MNIDAIIEGIDSLQPVSYVGDKIMKILNDPESPVADLVDIIKYDQSMTANLLRICNSSYFGLHQEVASIKQAVTFLGVEKVACLVMMGNSARNFNRAQQGYDLNEGELWRYSVASALIAQDLAERKNLGNPAMLFTSALIKDIGKVVLHGHVQDAYGNIKKAVQENGRTFLEAEREFLGIDHAELGAMIAEKWNFSPTMVNIIRHHHTPKASASNDPQVAVVYLADAICMMMGIGVGSDGLAYRYHQDIVDQLSFTEIDMQQTIANFQEQLKGVEEMVQFTKGDN